MRGNKTLSNYEEYHLSILSSLASASSVLIVLTHCCGLSLRVSVLEFVLKVVVLEGGAQPLGGGSSGKFLGP
jgi:hypothetical protein